MNQVAEIGHNSAAVGEILAENPSIIFTEKGTLESLVEEIRKEIEDHEPDTGSDAGRKKIASLAYSIARRKKSIDEAGKALNEEHREAISKVDAVRREAREQLDVLRDQARLPLTEWEKAEQEREAIVHTTLETLSKALNGAHFSNLDEVADLRSEIEALEITEKLFAGKYVIVRKERESALAALDDAATRIKKEQADREELERLRAEKAKADEEERRRAAEQAAKEAEAKRIAEAEKAAAERAAEQERQKAAEALRKEQQERQAAEAELARQKREKEEAERAERARREDQEHRSAIMTAAKEAIIEYGDVPEAKAKKLVLAICADAIPHVSIRF